MCKCVQEVAAALQRPDHSEHSLGSTVWGTDPNPPPICSPGGQLAAISTQDGQVVSVNKEWSVGVEAVLGEHSLPRGQRAGARAEPLPRTVPHTWRWSPVAWESGCPSLAAPRHTSPGHEVGTLSLGSLMPPGHG